MPHRLRDGENARPTRSPRWIDTGHELRYTTPEMLAIERGMIATAQAAMSARASVSPDAETVAAAIAARPTLTTDQRSMVQDVCQSPAGVVVDRGRRRGGQDLRPRRVPGSVRGHRHRGRRLRAGRTSRRRCSRAVRTSPLPGRSPAMLHELQVDHLPLRRRARGRRGGHDRRPRACRAGLARRHATTPSWSWSVIPSQLQPIERRAHRCAP